MSMTRGCRDYLLCPQRRLRACRNCKAAVYTLMLSPLVLSPGSLRTDTLIIVLSETKVGNRLHNNRCVSFHSCDLLPDIGQVSEKPVKIQVSRDNDPEGVMCHKGRKISV